MKNLIKLYNEKINYKTIAKKNITLAMLVTFFVLGIIIYFGYINGTKIGLISILAFYCTLAGLLTVLGVTLYFMENTFNARKFFALAVVLIISFLLIFFISRVINIYSVPLAICALLVSLLVGVKVSFFANLVVVTIFVLCERVFNVNSTLEESMFILLAGIVTSIISSYVVNRYQNRVKYLLLGVFLSCATLVTNYLLYFIFASAEVITKDFVLLGVYSLCSGIINIMFFLILVPLFEITFNLTTDFRLAELTSTNQPLLKKMLKEAPGTFNHSLIVASYAEACASAIGEDTFLARAAGYYHDIGKIKNPTYFKENQLDGHNPHDEITPELSISFIKKHTLTGLNIAREYHLPDEICRSIIEHHGTTPIKFFYYKAQKYTEGELDIDRFSYDGPKPSSKIAAIIMIADSCEAALRTLKEDEKSKADALVHNLIFERLNDDQFSECDITMKDLDIIETTIVTTYMGVSHERIKYPDQYDMEQKKNEN